MGRSVFTGSETFKTKAELDAYLKEDKKKNDKLLDRPDHLFLIGDGSDSGWGWTEAYNHYEVIESRCVFDTLDEAKDLLGFIVNENNKDDWSKTLAFARYRKSLPPIAAVVKEEKEPEPEPKRVKKIKVEEEKEPEPKQQLEKVEEWIVVYIAVSAHH